MKRRSKLWILAALATAALTASAMAATASPARVARPAAVAAKGPAGWQPWHLTSPSQFRLAAPPAASSAVTKSELAQLLRLQKRRTPAELELIEKWSGAGPVLNWTNLALQMIKSYRPRPPFAARSLALLHTAMLDALVAAEDSRLAYPKARPAPSVLDRRLKPLGKTSVRSTYAPWEAVVAGAAEKVMGLVFPAEPKRTFIRFANELVRCRLSAGLNYNSDLQRARLLGQRVAELVVARAASDGSTNTGFAHPQRTGEGFWSPTPPAFEPPIGGPVGTWKTWLMSSGGALRNVLPGPSPYGSPAFMRELRLVLETSEKLTPAQKQIASFWDDRPGTYTPAGHWFEIGVQLVKSYRVAPHQALRIFAYLATVEADAVIAAWEAKYYWWSIRPITAVWRLCDGGSRLCTEAELQANPARATYRNKWISFIATPGFPSYPSGHSAFSGGAGELLTYFLPKAGKTLDVLGEQAAISRLYGGIHFDEDNKAGVILGRAIAKLAIARAKKDGV